ALVLAGGGGAMDGGGAAGHAERAGRRPQVGRHVAERHAAIQGAGGGRDAEPVAGRVVAPGGVAGGAAGRGPAGPVRGLHAYAARGRDRQPQRERTGTVGERGIAAAARARGARQPHAGSGYAGFTGSPRAIVRDARPAPAVVAEHHAVDAAPVPETEVLVREVGSVDARDQRAGGMLRVEPAGGQARG